MKTELNIKWEECVDVIKNNVTEQQYDTWFSRLIPQSFDGGKLVLGVPNKFVYEILEEHYVGLLYKVITKVFGQNVQLGYCFVSCSEDAAATEDSSDMKSHSVSMSGDACDVRDESSQAACTAFDSHLCSNYTFDNFIEGDSNRLARSVGEAIALNPAQTFNPLFIYGPSGCGKTHLVNAIGWGVKKNHPELRVLYLSAHLFTVQYQKAVCENKVNDFIGFYQTVDVLIIDDVQELSGKQGTQNTFFHIFNHLHINNKQIILTADCPPVAIKGLEDRLLTRFKWGLQAEMEAATKTLRRDILSFKADVLQVRLSEEMKEYIAENVTNSIRDLEGVLHSLMAYSGIYKCDVDMAMIDRVLPKFVDMSRTSVTMETIKKTVCAHYKVSEAELCSQTRRQPISHIRQIVTYLASRMTEDSTLQIGKQLGGRNHSTILHSIKAIETLIQSNDEARRELELLEEKISRTK